MCISIPGEGYDGHSVLKGQFQATGRDGDPELRVIGGFGKVGRAPFNTPTHLAIVGQGEYALLALASRLDCRVKVITRSCRERSAFDLITDFEPALAEFPLSPVDRFAWQTAVAVMAAAHHDFVIVFFDDQMEGVGPSRHAESAPDLARVQTRHVHRAVSCCPPLA